MRSATGYVESMSQRSLVPGVHGYVGHAELFLARRSHRSFGGWFAAISGTIPPPAARGAPVFAPRQMYAQCRINCYASVVKKLLLRCFDEVNIMSQSDRLKYTAGFGIGSCSRTVNLCCLLVFAFVCFYSF